MLITPDIKGIFHIEQLIYLSLLRRHVVIIAVNDVWLVLFLPVFRQAPPPPPGFDHSSHNRCPLVREPIAVQELGTSNQSCAKRRDFPECQCNNVKSLYVTQPRRRITSVASALRRPDVL